VITSADIEEKLSGLRMGTSAFTAAGWPGTFYPKGLKPTEYLSFYSKHFNTVEIDSTFYSTPSEETVTRWREQTPEDFIFAAKAPQIITHEKCMQQCEEDLTRFLKTMDMLGGKLGPILFQFPYFGSQRVSYSDFLDRLTGFLNQLPTGGAHQFAIEVRNKSWINERFLSLLRERNVPLALIAHPWMWPPGELVERVDPVTSPFNYIRLLGDRYAIERITKRWGKLVLDREEELADWAAQCHRIRRGGKTIYFFANNHYAGHGPATLRIFRQLYLAGLGIDEEDSLGEFHLE
jgi:uncharacterized protein YecE (DUF72 family)